MNRKRNSYPINDSLTVKGMGLCQWQPIKKPLTIWHRTDFQWFQPIPDSLTIRHTLQDIHIQETIPPCRCVKKNHQNPRPQLSYKVLSLRRKHKLSTVPFCFGKTKKKSASTEIKKWIHNILSTSSADQTPALTSQPLGVIRHSVILQTSSSSWNPTASPFYRTTLTQL